MGTNVRQNIVTNGLVLYLDAGNRVSYVSGSTTWRDLSGNGNNGTLFNNPVFSTTNQGILSFNISSANQYSLVGTLGNYGSQMATNGITIDFVIRTTTSNLGQFGVLNTGSTTLLVINFNRDANDVVTQGNTSLAIRDQSGQYLIGAITRSIYTGEYFNVTATRQANTNVIDMYVNGVPQTVAYNTARGNPTTFNNFEFPFAIAATNNRGTISPMQCILPIYKMYNRALSPAEVAQNYNATKNRFGLT